MLKLTKYNKLLELKEIFYSSNTIEEMYEDISNIINEIIPSERNKIILQDRLNGNSLQVIADKFSLSHTRINMIWRNGIEKIFMYKLNNSKNILVSEDIINNIFTPKLEANLIENLELTELLVENGISVRLYNKLRRLITPDIKYKGTYEDIKNFCNEQSKIFLEKGICHEFTLGSKSLRELIQLIKNIETKREVN